MVYPGIKYYLSMAAKASKGEVEMDRGKERATLRTADLRRLIGQLESQRDITMDDLAKKQGELDTVERVIKHAYEIILDINKEEQLAEEDIKQKEEQRILQEAAAEKEKKAAARRKKKVEKKLDGLKNSTRTTETQERSRAGRARARARRKNKQESEDK